MNNIYKDNELSNLYYFLIICISMIFFGSISFFITSKTFNVKGFEEQFKEAQNIIDLLKEEAQGSNY